MGVVPGDEVHGVRLRWPVADAGQRTRLRLEVRHIQQFLDTVGFQSA